MHVHPKTEESVLRKANSNLLAKIIDEVKHLKNDAGRARMSSELRSDDYGSSDIFSSCSFPFLFDYYGWGHVKLKKLKLEFFLDNDEGYIQDFEYFKNPHEYKKRENYQEFKKYIENFYQKGQDDTKLYEQEGFIKIQYNNSVTSLVPEPLFDNPFGMCKVTKMELDKLVKKYSSQKLPKHQSLNGWMALEPIDKIDNSKLELQKRESDAGLWKPGFGSNEELDAIKKSMHLLNSELDQVNMKMEELTYELSLSIENQLDNREAQSQ
jgi:hypothetical protein